MTKPPAAGGSRLTLETPVTYLAGVGPHRAELLKRLRAQAAGQVAVRGQGDDAQIGLAGQFFRQAAVG